MLLRLINKYILYFKDIEMNLGLYCELPTYCLSVLRLYTLNTTGIQCIRRFFVFYIYITKLN